jgi:hypothetical protein
MKKLGDASLEDRINALRAEVDTFIDRRTAQMKEQCPGVPDGVLRNLLVARAPGCQCAAYLRILEGDGKADAA